MPNMRERKPVGQPSRCSRSSDSQRTNYKHHKRYKTNAQAFNSPAILPAPCISPLSLELLESHNKHPLETFCPPHPRRAPSNQSTVSLGLPSLQRCVVKFLVRFDLELGFKFGISDEKNLVKSGEQAFLPAGKAHEISGRIS